MAELIHISKAEYTKLKHAAQIDWELVEKIKKSFEDIKHGRMSEVKPKYFK